MFCIRSSTQTTSESYGFYYLRRHVCPIQFDSRNFTRGLVVAGTLHRVPRSSPSDVARMSTTSTTTYPARQYMQTTSTSSQPTTSPCAKSTRSRQQHWATGSSTSTSANQSVQTSAVKPTVLLNNEERPRNLLADVEDLSRRKMLAVTAFRFMWSLCGLFRVVSGSETEKQNAFHRKQLRSFIRVQWPQRKSNLKLYKRCRCHKISKYVLELRWRSQPTLGRVGAYKPSNVCLLPKDGLHGYRSRPRTVLPSSLDTDLQQIGMRLKTRADLEQLRRIAINKTMWSKLHRTL